MHSKQNNSHMLEQPKTLNKRVVPHRFKPPGYSTPKNIPWPLTDVQQAKQKNNLFMDEQSVEVLFVKMSGYFDTQRGW